MQKTLLTFPCQFPIKIVGPANESFEGLVVGIVRQYVPDLGEGAITVRYSENGKYISMTATINAKSQEQLDNLYRALSGNSDILMVL